MKSQNPPHRMSLVGLVEETIQRKEVARRILLLISQVVGSGGGWIFSLVEDQGVYGLTASLGSVERSVRGKKIVKTDPLIRLIGKGERVILRGAKGTDPAVGTWLGEVGMEVLLPFHGHSRLVGFCALAKRKQGNYTPPEVRLLEELAGQAALLLENAFLREALRKARLLMQRANRARSIDAISGGFAHEIRNPLTSIKTFISLVPQMKDDTEFINHFSQVALEDVDRIERLLDDVLQFARAQELKLAPEDLNDLVSSSVYFIRMEAEKQGVKVRVELGGDLAEVFLDRQQIKQVLLNLFLNAIDAMKEGGLLSVKTLALSKEGSDWAQIEVSDSGSGIPDEVLPFIFDPFFTTKTDEGADREGTGLGLAIVHQIIEEHHGRIEVKSRLGEGTTFRVLIPRSLRIFDSPQAAKAASQ